MEILKELAIALIIVAAVILVLAGVIPGNAQTYTTYDHKKRAVPTSYETYKSTGAWNDSNATFAMISSAKGKKLRITLANVTTTDTFNVIVYKNGTSVYQVYHQQNLTDVYSVATSIRKKTRNLPDYY